MAASTFLSLQVPLRIKGQHYASGNGCQDQEEEALFPYTPEAAFTLAKH